jgi:glycosyltransferase involved in cell wall biosynthesis
MLLTAVNMAREQVPDIRLLLVGDGPQRQELMAVTASLGLREVVTFAGAQPWPMDEIGAADAVALSSVWEGSPIVAVETLRIGTPLVTTAVGSLPEYLHDGKNCRMVPVGDAAAFSAALVWTLTQPEPARQLGQRGRGVAEELFSPDKLARSVAEVYDEVVG